MNSYKTRILKNVIGGILTFVTLILAFFAIVNLTFNFLYIKTTVRGYSMLPTINSNVESSEIEGDTIYINDHSKLNVNDIVVAKPSWYTRYIIKRLVGKPGDTIEIKDLGETFGLYVNNSLLYEKQKNGVVDEYQRSGSLGYYEIYKEFLNKPEFEQYVETQQNGNKVIHLEDDEYFLMGDNWGQTLDCLTKGPITKEELTGKVDLIIDVNQNNLIETTKFFLNKIFSKN